MMLKEMFKPLALTVIVIVLSVPVVSNGQAQPLKIDVQPTGGTTAPGWEAFEATNQDLGSIGSTAYSAFGGIGNVQVSLAIENLPAGSNNNFRAVARNGAADDFNNDWLGLDARDASTVDAALVFTISGLPVGTYDWTSYHHDGGAGSTNGNIDGLADYSLLDATGTTTVADGIAFSREDMMQSVFSLSSTIVSDGSDVVFSIIKDNGQGDADDSNAIFGYIGAFEVSAVPEPSSSLMLIFGLLGLALVRRNR
jgi:hypothetical protein